jgi:hypothetical protein
MPSLGWEDAPVLLIDYVKRNAIIQIIDFILDR